MSEAPEKQPQSKRPNVWAVGFAALFAGYLMGQYNSHVTQSGASAAPSISPAVAPATTDMNAVDMNATDMNATEAAATPAAPVRAGAPEVRADDSQSTPDQPAYAYAPAAMPPTAPDDSQTPAAQVASSDEASNDNTAAAATVASNAPSYQPQYSYSSPSTGYSSSNSSCVGTGCYGVISNITGLPRTTYVHGYFRKNGTYVQPYYRSHRH